MFWIFSVILDLIFEHGNQILSQNTPAYDDVPLNQVWLQKHRQVCKCGLIFFKNHILMKQAPIVTLTSEMKK